MHPSEKPEALRREAAKLRSLALTPTEGAHDVDRYLMQLAARLELVAATLETQAPPLC